MAQENQVVTLRRIVFVLSVACAFLAGALLAPRFEPPAQAQGGKVESRCVKTRRTRTRWAATDGRS